MAKSRVTFGKLQREKDKQAKAQAKRERRQSAPVESESVDNKPSGSAAESEHVLIDLIAGLHDRFENGEVSLEEYEEQKAELLSRLPID